MIISINPFVEQFIWMPGFVPFPIFSLDRLVSRPLILKDRLVTSETSPAFYFVVIILAPLGAGQPHSLLWVSRIPCSLSSDIYASSENNQMRRKEIPHEPSCPGTK